MKLRVLLYALACALLLAFDGIDDVARFLWAATLFELLLIVLRIVREAKPLRRGRTAWALALPCGLLACALYAPPERSGSLQARADESNEAFLLRVAREMAIARSR